VSVRTIGDIEVPVAGVGCNNFGRRIDEARAREVVHAALEVGSRLFDTADSYGDGASEQFLGRALGSRRDQAVIVTKFGGRNRAGGLFGGDPRWVPHACDASLARLGTDRIDVYLLHQPDERIPVVDTLGAMSDLVDEGKVREIGCSNFSAQQLEEAADTAKDGGLKPFVVVQNDYNLLRTNARHDVLAACRRLGVGLIPYYPLAAGVLSGKYRRGSPPPHGSRLSGPRANELVDDALALVERLEAFAESRGHTMLELALSWLASQPEIPTVIAGATSGEQIRENAAATESWRLTRVDFEAVDEILGR
jgi:aryl-alcohol dehydrogenase-like predicted oxidoreductase